MTRESLLLALARYQQHAVVAGLQFADNWAGFKYALDSTLMVLGVAEADLDLPLTSYNLSYVDADLLVRYFGLQQIYEVLSLKVDTQADNPTVRSSDSQMAKAIWPLLQQLQKQVDERGYGGPQFTLGRLQLDIFEPQQGNPSPNMWFGP